VTAGNLELIVAVLNAGAADCDAGGENAGFSLLDHGLQCAAHLRAARPADLGLQIAGLVHDIGHTLSGNDDELHGRVAARFVAPVLGARVAALIALHVPAKRYLVTVDPRYSAGLSPASRRSLLAQGSTMNANEAAEFQATPHAMDAVALRRADDAAKVAGAVVPDLSHWIPLIEDFAGGVNQGNADPL
jgi:predicted HD phosphohydrolase